MPTRRTKVSSAPTNGHTVAEMQKWYNQYKDQIESFANGEDARKILRDVSKAITLPSNTYSKDNLRTYLKNIISNESNLRNLSRFLYHRSHSYMKLINYYANMFCLYAYSVVPNVNLVKSNNNRKILKSFYDTASVADRMNLQGEFLKVYTTCFIEDVFYGVKYLDDTGMIIIKLDPDYCRIAGEYSEGDLIPAMNMSYFNSRQTLLDYLGEPFTTMYKAYQKDTRNELWQVIPDEYSVCLKFSYHDWQTIAPPFSGLLESVISLCDLESIQAIADKQDIYKMVYLKIPTLSGAKDVNKWAVDPKVVEDYFNKMIDGAIPDYISSVITPGVDLGTVSFNESDRVSDTNKLSKAYKTLFNIAGGGQVLISDNISTTEAYKQAKIADTEFAISSLLPQTQSWVNRHISYEISNPAKITFMPVSVYTKDDYKSSLLTDGQNGLPVRLALNALNGFSVLQTLSLLILENDILQLDKKFIPLISSNTVSHTSGTTAQDGNISTGSNGEGNNNE